jgi:hypothetical protein
MPATPSESSAVLQDMEGTARPQYALCAPFMRSSHCGLELPDLKLPCPLHQDDVTACRFFEDVMRKNSSSPNKLMESLHLKRFADEGSRQAAAVSEATAAVAAAHAAGRAAFRDGLKNQMATARHEKATQLQRDEAVHAAILRHQVTSSAAGCCLCADVWTLGHMFSLAGALSNKHSVCQTHYSRSLAC